MHQAHSRNHLVQAAGKYTQHSNRIGLIDWLVEDRAIHHDDRVGSQNAGIRMSTRNGQRLLTRQSLSASARGLARVWSLVDISRLGIEWNTRIAQKFLASRGRRCEDQHGFKIVLRSPIAGDLQVLLNFANGGG
jgi:hypothetical protein